ncbi:MAG: DUF4878 domain-containing protein [Saezia sp.]
MLQLTQFKTLFLAFFCTFFLAACGGASEETVIKDYMNAIASGNVDKAITMIYIKPKDINTASEKAALEGKLKAMLLEMKEKGFDPRGGIKNIEFLNKTFSEDKKNVNVEYKITFGDGTYKTDSQRLVLIDNAWKIDF